MGSGADSQPAGRGTAGGAPVHQLWPASRRCDQRTAWRQMRLQREMLERRRRGKGRIPQGAARPPAVPVPCASLRIACARERANARTCERAGLRTRACACERASCAFARAHRARLRTRIVRTRASIRARARHALILARDPRSQRTSSKSSGSAPRSRYSLSRSLARAPHAEV